jgi:GT2 family glycosyltransferase
MVSESSVCAVVVTRDRRELLEGCLERIEHGSRAPEAIVVVDNASSDGTAAMLAERFPAVEVVRLEENAGGAGGFARGVARAAQYGHDWLWILDDDTWPEPDALTALMAGADRAPAVPNVLASVVRWTDGRMHPMNAPLPRPRPVAGAVAAAAAGLVAIRYATFVSVLVRGAAVRELGVPRAGYFLSGDDVEYTARLLRDAPGFLVPESEVVHRTATPSRPTPDGERFYFHARNGLYLLRSGSLRGGERVRYARWWAGTVREHLAAAPREPARLRRVGRALRDGLGRPPS